VVVADLSAVQLDLNRQHVMDADAIDGVERWERADICDLPAAWRGGFDAVVAYGGVLSYVFDDATTAARQCLQALDDGGVFVGSVMSLAGNARSHSSAILELSAAVTVVPSTSCCARVTSVPWAQPGWPRSSISAWIGSGPGSSTPKRRSVANRARSKVAPTCCSPPAGAPAEPRMGSAPERDE
jgi:hypothetical protein